MIFFYILREVVFILLYVVGSVLGNFIDISSVNPNSSKKTPIVIVHGWFSRSLNYYQMKRYFEGLGYPVYMAKTGVNLADIDTLSTRLKKFIDNKELKNFILIGGSLGGVISLNYLQNMNGWPKTKMLFSLGSPFSGTPLSYLIPFSGSGRQLTPDNDFLEKLMGEKLVNRNKIITLKAGFDEFVPAKRSSVEGAKNLIVDIIGHVNLQSSEKTFKMIEEEIRKLK